MHDFRTQKDDTFETFRQIDKGFKLPKTGMVIYIFVAEEVAPKWAAVEKALRAAGFDTRNDGDVLEARVGPISIDPDTIWHWEKLATEIVLPFEFWPESWELED